MKQVLSVADFAIILDLVNREIHQLERKEEPIFFNGYDDKKWIEEQQERINKMHEERINSPYYKSLIHLKKSLENLNVEVETPDVKIEQEINVPNSICDLH